MPVALRARRGCIVAAGGLLVGAREAAGPAAERMSGERKGPPRPGGGGAAERALLKPPAPGASRVAVFLGTFDPLHLGHVAAAQACLDAGVSEVVFVPGAASRKPGASARAHRLELAALVLQGRPGMNLLLAEPALPSQGAWSLRPLREQVRALYGEVEVAELHGSDPFVDFPPQRNPEYFDGQIIYLVDRPPQSPVHANFDGLPAHFVALEAQRPCSSTELRRRLHAGADAQALFEAGLATESQLRYITEKGLYGRQPPAGGCHPPSGAEGPRQG
eukprot:TRINITY_DN3605_c5_g1_i1.p2 TRINITY_DN3605_c5_g1~~TRINITY_DN3605_c5_g1_i1.p2  ORF type:complete len:305 (+),score=85.02 TRINITY_DN3605_c5_g1_i1:89-916(+)